MSPLNNSITSPQATGDQAVSVGFLGCGTIASAIATGLSSHPKVSHIAVTRRSERKSEALLELLGPEKVSIHDNNQDVVDACDLCFVCVLPQQTRSVLQQLKFAPDRHTLISLVSTSKLDELADDSSLPSEKVFKMICLPAVKHGEGVSLITPKREHPILLPLLDHLGGYVQAETPEQMSALMVPSGMMGSMYGVLRTNRDWLVKKHQVDMKDATYLVTKYYWSMMQEAVRQLETNPRTALDDLIDEQTPGGINEQTLRNLERLGAMQAYEKASDAMFERIQGTSDGIVGTSATEET